MTLRNRLALLCAVIVILALSFAGSGRAAILRSRPFELPAASARVALAPTGAALAPAIDLAERAVALASERSLGERAMDTVHVLAEEIGSRPAGSANERRAAAYLADEYRALGYTVQVVSFPFNAGSSRGESQNVEARFPDEDPAAPLVIIGAHYDSVPAGPGANDNGSGTATILEVARELAAAPVPGIAVRFVSFGAEEVGLHGSRAYVSAMSPVDRQRTVLMMSVDMMAVGDQPAFGGTPEWVFQAMARAESQGYRPIDQSNRLRRMSDHASFIDAGIPALMFHWVDDPFYHTAMDVPANLNPAAMDLMGAIILDLLRVAAN